VGYQVLVPPTVIDAVPDDFSGTPVPVDGGNTPSVLGNDRLNGAGTAPADVLPSLVNDGGIPGLLLSGDGSLTVPPNTPAGSYTATYQLCSAAVPAVCDTATVLIRVAQPAAVDDSSTGNVPGSSITLPVLANDLSVGGPVIVPSSVVIVGAPGDGKQLSVPGQGVWSVNPTSGAITFTPVAGFVGSPSAIQYTVRDSANNLSNAASVSVSYMGAPAAIPTLSFWGLCLLASAMALLMLRQQRRARGHLK
jgi:CshA-type fibril repeat protein